MTFDIYKTSEDTLYDVKNQPCEGSYKTVKERTIRWLIQDENSKAIYQEIPRKVNRWSIDINTIEELIALMKEVGSLIIYKDNHHSYSIEIYDDYRE